MGIRENNILFMSELTNTAGYRVEADVDGDATLTDRVFAVLREEIAQGKLAPGTKLVRRELSQRLGASTIPVMEALRRLEQDGLVEHQAYSGTRVRAITEQGVRDDSELREALESQVARLCAQRCTDADFNRLYYLAGRVDGVMAGTAPQSSQGMRLHMDFHLTLARCSGCILLADELEKLWFREMMLFCWDSARFKPVPLDWHHDLIDAIASHDPVTADAQAREHTRYGIDAFIFHLRDQKSASHDGPSQTSDKAM